MFIPVSEKAQGLNVPLFLPKFGWGRATSAGILGSQKPPNVLLRFPNSSSSHLGFGMRGAGEGRAGMGKIPEPSALFQPFSSHFPAIFPALFQASSSPSPVLLHTFSILFQAISQSFSIVLLVLFQPFSSHFPVIFQPFSSLFLHIFHCSVCLRSPQAPGMCRGEG